MKKKFQTLPVKNLLKRNNSRFAGIVLALFFVVCLFPVSEAGAALFKKKQKQKVAELETSEYRIYYLTGAPEKKPDLGEGDYSELQYKIVYQHDWVPDDNRLIEADFLDSANLIVTRDVVADKLFNPQGEYYGSLWIKSGQEKNIKKAEVHEVVQKNKAVDPESSVKIEKKKVEQIRKPFDRKKYYVAKNPKLDEIFNRKVLTEKDIQEALSLTRPAGSATASAEDKQDKEKVEGEDGEEVNLETSFA